MGKWVEDRRRALRLGRPWRLAWALYATTLRNHTARPFVTFSPCAGGPWRLPLTVAVRVLSENLHAAEA